MGHVAKIASPGVAVVGDAEGGGRVDVGFAAAAARGHAVAAHGDRGHGQLAIKGFCKGRDHGCEGDAQLCNQTIGG